VLSGGFRQEGEELGGRQAVLRFWSRSNLVASSWIDKHRLVPLGEWVPACAVSGAGAAYRPSVGVEPGARLTALCKNAAPRAQLGWPILLRSLSRWSDALWQQRSRKRCRLVCVSAANLRIS